MSVRILALLLATGLAGPAAAELSLKEREQAKEEDAAFAEELAYANEKCATKIKAAIDWKSFEGTPAFSGKYSVAGYCAPAVRGLRWQCEKDDLGKAAARRIKAITCRFASQGERSATLKKGRLTFRADLGAANGDDFVKAFLVDELGLAEDRAVRYQEAEMKKEVAWADKKCGTELDFSIDWPSFRQQRFLETNYSVHGYCDGVLDGLERVCADPDGKLVVKDTIKKVVCRLDTQADEGKTRRLERKGDTLIWTFGWEAANTSDFTKEWLMEHL